MRGTTWMALAVVSAVLLSGCATAGKLQCPDVGMTKTLALSDKERADLARTGTEAEVALLLDREVEAQLPTSLALARLHSGYYGGRPDLTRVPVAEREQWQQMAADHGRIVGVQAVTSLTVDREDDEPVALSDLRLAAARQGCELLLVYVQGEGSVDNLNDAAVLYWTLVGLWLVPGNVVEHETVYNGILVDCRSGAILGTATGDARDRRVTAAAYTGAAADGAARKAREEAFNEFRDNCDRLLGQVTAPPAASP